MATKRWAIALTSIVIAVAGCSHERPPPPARSPAEPARAPRVVELDTPNQLETTTAYRASLGRGAELFLPPWFAARRGGYDLLVHFHGEGRWQQANIAHAKLNVAVISVNLGVGTAPYSNAFRSPDAFERLLADTQAEVAKSGRADGSSIRRIALSAWSAGFSSIASAMNEDVAQRVDALLLADGFFTHFVDRKKRTVNARGLAKFARFAEAAERDEKLFAITHTTIPTGPYPSVQECVAKLLELIDLPKSPEPAIGPRDMHQIYAVDRGSFHVRGYEGTRASDHVRQLHAMGETMYPWLKERWDRQDSEALAAGAGAPRSGSSRPRSAL